MKKIMALMIVCFAMKIHAQKYHFDYFIERENIRTYPSKQIEKMVYFADSKSNTILNIDKTPKKTLGYFFDQEKNYRHVYNVIEEKESLSFQYLYTNSFSLGNGRNDSKTIENYLEIKKLSDLKYEITIYKSERKKMKWYGLILTFEKSPYKFFDIDVENRSKNKLTTDLKRLLDSEFYIVKEQITKYYVTDFEYKNTLKTIQPVDLTIDLPSKLIFKDFDFEKEAK